MRFFLRKCAVYNRFCGFNIHRRWSIAHLYQAVLNGEEHVKDIAHINTLAGYIHYQLTGKRQVGIGEASGIFPVDGIGYNAEYIAKVDEKLAEKGFSGKLLEVLPGVLNAGAREAALTAELSGHPVAKPALYDMLYYHALTRTR